MEPIAFGGFVEKGEGFAAKLGCPTANVAVEVGAVIPGLGVYVGETAFDGARHPSLICINDGRDGKFLKLEVHILNACPDLNEKYLHVTLLDKFRSLVPFETAEQMSSLIAKDIDRAREWFRENA